jgi:hypothetical protein
VKRHAVARAAAVLLLFRAGAAGADGKASLDAAAQAIDSVDFEAARKHAEAAIAGGDLSAGQLVRAYRLLGEINGALDQEDAARDAFLRWILLDDAAALPSGMSPKITVPFTAAKKEAADLGRFEVAPQLRRRPGLVVVDVTRSDPLHLIAKLEVNGREGDHAEIPAEDGEAVRVEVVAFDARGNQLAKVEATAEARAVAEPEPPRPGRKHKVPRLLRWPTWAGVAVVAGGAGGFFAWRVGQAQDDLDALNASSSAHSFDEATAIQDRGERDALIANVAIATAGVAVAAALITYLVDRD